MHIIARLNRGKAHCVFAHLEDGLNVTYCGLRWKSGFGKPSRKQKHCKHCTKDLHKGGMSWEWYESQAAKSKATRPGLAKKLKEEFA